MTERKFDCTVISRDPGQVTVRSYLAWHKVDVGLVRKGGEQVREGLQIPLGTKGVITVVKGGVRLLEVQLAKEDWESMWKANSDVYSEGIFRINVLESEDRAAHIARLISRKCVGVRKCTGGLPIALAVGYIEHLLRKSTPIAYLQQLIQRSKELLAGNTDGNYSGIVEKLMKLERYKREGKSAVKWLASQSKEKVYWDRVASFLRDVLFPAFLHDPGITASLGGLTGTEVENPDSSLYPTIMACGLSLRLVFFSPHKYKTCYQTSTPNQHLAVIMLYTDGQMCHLLYNKGMLELENYSLDMMMPGPGGQHNPKLLYYTTPNREQSIEIAELDAESIRRQIAKVCNAGLAAQNLVRALLGKLAGSGQTSKFITEEFVSESKQFKQEHSQNLLRLREFLDANPSTNTDLTQQLTQVQLLELLASLPLFSLRLKPKLSVCQSCHRECPRELFPSLCLCRLCIFCLCGAYRRQPASCQCTQLQSPAFFTQLQDYKVLCLNCMEKKSALLFYSQVQCEDHWLCRQCLALKTGEKTRCFYCKRVYKAQEVAVIQEIQQRRCMYYTEFCTSEMLETDCGCVICLKCAKDLAKAFEMYTKCFGCSQFLSSSASVLLYSLLNEAENADCPLCAICSANISEKTAAFRLGCSHTFHKDCYRDKVEGKYCYLTCPVESCEYRPSLRVVQRSFPDLYAKLEEVQSSISCPQCKAPVNRENVGESNYSEVKCPNCGYSFCVFCLQQYSNPHSPPLCAEKQLQAETNSLRRQAERTNNRVLQCAGCQHLLLAPSDSPEVQCRTCSMLMCALCVVPKHVYAVHGEAWHRRSCPRYCRESRNGGFCVQCRNSGKECTPPED